MSLKLLLVQYLSFLFAVGNVANLMFFGLCIRERLRKVPTFVFMAFNALTKPIVLYTYPFKQLLSIYPLIDLAEISPFWCVLSGFIQPFGQL